MKNNEKKKKINNLCALICDRAKFGHFNTAVDVDKRELYNFVRGPFKQGAEFA